jgi:formylglycine-generating enzyme required for sulfatase activity
MRLLVAALLLSLGTALAQAATKDKVSESRAPSPTRRVSSTPTVKTRKTIPMVVPEKGKNFDNSLIDPGAAPLFVWIKPGTFQMGSPENEAGRTPDEAQHWVKLERGFWLLDHEVTRREYAWIMQRSVVNDSRPINDISWYQAKEFCKKLTELDRSGGRIFGNQEYRLPTEAEWEYAARAGTTGAWYTVDGKSPEDSLPLIAVYNKSSPYPVKTKRPNDWGLYDMIGNVMEFCEDWYGDYPKESVSDPTGPSAGSQRVVRGGYFESIIMIDGSSLFGDLRSAQREPCYPNNKWRSIGFRPALVEVK